VLVYVPQPDDQLRQHGGVQLLGVKQQEVCGLLDAAQPVRLAGELARAACCRWGASGRGQRRRLRRLIVGGGGGGELAEVLCRLRQAEAALGPTLRAWAAAPARACVAGSMALRVGPEQHRQ
jgi:hypothetical protein